MLANPRSYNVGLVDEGLPLLFIEEEDRRANPFPSVLAAQDNANVFLCAPQQLQIVVRGGEEL